MVKSGFSLLGISLAVLATHPLSVSANSLGRLTANDIMVQTTLSYDEYGGTVKRTYYIDAAAYRASGGEVVNVIDSATAIGVINTSCSGIPTLPGVPVRPIFPDPAEPPRTIPDYTYTHIDYDVWSDDGGGLWSRKTTWKRSATQHPDGTYSHSDWLVYEMKYAQGQMVESICNMMPQ